MRYLISGLSLSILLLAACTPIISEQSRKLINTDATFSTLKTAPENFIGKNIMLGGRIANVRNTKEGALIEIVQFDLTYSDYPEETFISHGRFLASNSNFMDPLVFKTGMLITLIGEIKGKKTLRLEDIDYTYPVIEMREWYVWRTSEHDRGYLYPTAAPQYNPFNYGYGYEPFLPRPYYPPYPPR